MRYAVGDFICCYMVIVTVTVTVTATATAILKIKVESNGIRDFNSNSNYLSPCNSFGLTKKYCGFSPCTYIVKAKVENAKLRQK